MSVNASGSNGTSLVHKMSKKVSQQTKVIHQLNTRSDEQSYDRECLSQQHEWEMQQVLQSCNMELQSQHGKVDVYLVQNRTSEGRIQELEEEQHEERKLRQLDRQEWKENGSSLDKLYKEQQSRVSQEAEQKVSGLEEELKTIQTEVQGKLVQLHQFMALQQTSKEEELQQYTSHAQQEQQRWKELVETKTKENEQQLVQVSTLTSKLGSSEADLVEQTQSKNHWQGMYNSAQTELVELRDKYELLDHDKDSMGNSQHAVEKARLDMESKYQQLRDRLEQVLKDHEEQSKKGKIEFQTVQTELESTCRARDTAIQGNITKDKEIASLSEEQKKLQHQLSSLNVSLQMNTQESTSTMQEQSRQKQELLQSQELCKNARQREQELQHALGENRTRESALTKGIESKEEMILSLKHRVSVQEVKLKSMSENHAKEIDMLKQDSSMMRVDLVERERSDWEARLQKKEEENSKLYRELDEVKKELTLLQQNVDSKDSNIKELLGKQTDIQEKQDTLSKQYDVEVETKKLLMSQITDLESVISSTNMQVQTLGEDITRLTSEKEEVNQKNHVQLQEIHTLQTRLSTLESQYNQTDNVQSQKVSHYMTEQEMKNKQLVDLNSIVTKLKQEVFSIEQGKLDIQTQLQELQRTHETHLHMLQGQYKKKEDEQLQKQKQEAEKYQVLLVHRDTIQLEQKDVTTKQKDVEQSYSTLEQEHKKLELELTRLKQNLLDVQEKANSMNSNKHGLEEQVGAQKHQIGQFENEISALQREKEGLHEETKLKQSKIDSLTKQLQQILLEKQQVERQAEQVQQNIQAKLKEIEFLSKKTKDLEQQHGIAIQQKEQDIHALNQIQDTCKADIRTLQSQLELARQDQENEKREYKNVLESLTLSNAQKLQGKEEEQAKLTSHFHEMETSFRNEQVALDGKFKSRPMREEDAMLIGQLKQALKKCDTERKQAMEDVKFYKLELVNREELYNKQFTSGGAKPTKIGR